jgi:hypothetical protein
MRIPPGYGLTFQCAGTSTVADMRITVLAVPDCPNAALAMERVTAALDGRPAEVELVEVRDEDEATARGMTGSPTILVDGVDPSAQAGAMPSLSCRLYGDGVPGVAELRAALETALDVVGRAGRGRRAPAERGLRAVHQAVLRHFAATGLAPDRDELEPAAERAGRTAVEVLAELADEDFLTLDEAGNIHAAYPFSATPTRHQVRIDGDVRVWSMCAIDALGIPPMLGADAVISSTDPVTGEPITVTARGAATIWEPPGAVVFVGQRPGGGPAATACCGALNFFGSPATARTWVANHPEIRGRIVSQADAETIARQTFGTLL